MSIDLIANVVQIIGFPIMIGISTFTIWRRLDLRLTVQDNKLQKIDYALFNEGKTGLVNKVDQILDNQASMNTSIAVLESKVYT